MTILRIPLFAMVLLFAVTTMVFATESRYTPVEGLVAKKVDAYDYFVDYSGSMMMGHKQLKDKKIDMAKQVMADINALLPDLDYTAGLYTLAPYGKVLEHKPWDRRIMHKQIDALQIDLDIFSRTTDMGDSLIAHGTVITSEQGKKALLLFSDGEANRGPNPVIEARNLLQANPDLCLHIVSVADTEQGQATLDAIGKLRRCTVSAKAWELVADEDVLRQFVSDIFYEERLEEVIVLRGVNFAFDSTVIDATAQSLLNEVARAIRRQTLNKVQLSGFTDTFGSDQYNESLSQRRAEAVQQYLVGRGIAPERFIVKGMGKSFTYDNSTEEGCYMNRRVEVTFLE